MAYKIDTTMTYKNTNGSIYLQQYDAFSFNMSFTVLHTRYSNNGTHTIYNIPLEVLARLSAGVTLDRPPDCPSELHEIMRATWIVDPEKRPTFADIQPRMETIRGFPAFQVRGSSLSFHSRISKIFQSRTNHS